MTFVGGVVEGNLSEFLLFLPRRHSLDSMTEHYGDHVVVSRLAVWAKILSDIV